MKKFAFGTIMLFALLLSMSTVLSSCGKVKESIAKITVIDGTTGDPVVGSLVYLRAVSTNGNTAYMFTPISAQTDAKGVATFNLSEYYEAGQAGLMVLTIDVDAQTDVGIIKIVEQEVNEKTVEL